jgi:two-component system sensor histidine kinase KdpD
MLDMSRLQAGAVLVHCQDIDLDGVIAQTLASLGPSGDSIGVDVIEGLYTVHADPGLPERVLGNLLENALRMSPADCPASIVVRAASGVVQIKVIDHGWRRSWPLSGLTMVVSLPAERPAT